MWVRNLSDKETATRKLEHIKIVLERNVEASEGTLLNYVRLLHNPLPELNFDEIDISMKLFGKKLNAPIMITGMTGGHPEVTWINSAIARVAEKYGIAMGVGSQRAALEDPSLENSFKVARENAPNALIVANIGGAQLAKGLNLEQIDKIINMIKADALAIHLNPAQEVFQPEGEPIYRNVIRSIKRIVDELSIPIIVKETGAGLNGVIARELWEIGIKCFDVSGLGGTSWIKVESLRKRFRRNPDGFPDHWGNPTALSIIDIRTSVPEACIIASGGIRTGLDIAKSIALGSDLTGFALPALRALSYRGEEGLERLLDDVIWQLKVVMFLTGSKKLDILKLTTPLIWGRLADEMEILGISLEELLRAKLRRILTQKKR